MYIGKKKEPVRVPFDPEADQHICLEQIFQKKICSVISRRLIWNMMKRQREVIAPTFRHDLFRMADLAEEVARFYGYDNIPTTLPRGEATTGKLSFKLRVEEVARDIAEFCGFSQGMTYSFESPKVFDKLLLAGGFTASPDS